MADLQWTKTLSVGDDAIDDDHKSLFKLVHEFETAEITDHVVADALNRLERYAEEHFAREEDYMRAIGYPGLEAHIQEHKMFVEWIETTRHAFQRTPATYYYVGEQVNEFLEKWLVNHIMSSDKKYGEFAASKGGEEA